MTETDPDARDAATETETDARAAARAETTAPEAGGPSPEAGAEDGAAAAAFAKAEGLGSDLGSDEGPDDEDPGEDDDEEDEDPEEEDESGDGDDGGEDEEDEGEEDDEDEEAGDEDAEPVAEPRATFADLGLSEPVLRAVTESGYLHPTPIQEQAIPVVLMGRDVLGVAQTGTGKTAGFTLPMLDILAGSRAKARMPRSLILEPTRELALQVAENFVKYGRHLSLNHALLIGGESMDEQKAALERGADVLIATPGRLLDLFERGRILLADCKLLVIDEADRMLDMGFIPDVERIVSLLPRLRQTLFFSATMAPEIRRLGDAFLSNPREISVSAPASVASTITAGLAWVRDGDKREALRRLIAQEEVQNALIFCNRKVEVDVLYKSLKRHGFSVGALHGDLPQPVRFATLERFKAGEIRLLVCSDVAARGLDIGGLSHVFNYDVPFHAEDYVHRIGRTGRAGREGRAFTIALAEDARLVDAVERLTGRPVPPIAVPGLDPAEPEAIQEALRAPRGRGRGGRAGGGAPGRGRESGRGRREEPRREARRDGSGREEPRRGAAKRGGPEREGAQREGAQREGAQREGAQREGTRREGTGGDAAEREEPRRDRPRRGEVRRDGPGREDRARDAQGGEGLTRGERVLEEVERASREPRPRREEGRRDEPRREERGREDRPRREEGRRDEARREGGRSRSDDLGPAVRGFGDAVPAFMLIPVPRPRPRSEEPEGAEAEAA